MTSPVDIRSVAAKLLKGHHMNLMNSGVVDDPSIPGTKVTMIEFRVPRNHNPKAFFDSLNENGIQYSKETKDPNATVIKCRLWPKGAKSRALKAKDEYKKRVKGQDKGSGETGGGVGVSPYLGPPSAGTASTLVMSNTKFDDTARELLEGGHVEDAIELLKIAGEQSWEEFGHKVKEALSSADIYQSPEARNLRERVVSSIIKALGPDAVLLKDMRAVDLSSKLGDYLSLNMDLLLGTREMADSLIRRVSADYRRAEKQAAVQSGYRSLLSSLTAGTAAYKKAEALREVDEGPTPSPLAPLLEQGRIAEAKLLLLEL